MKRSEWAELAVWMRGYWPHAPIPSESVAVQYEVVRGVDVGTARAVVRLFACEAHQFPPTAGMILARAVEVVNPTPEWDQVQAEVEAAVVAKRPVVVPLECGVCDGSGLVVDESANTARDCECRVERVRRGRRCFEWSHELVGEWMSSVRWRRWEAAVGGGVGLATFRAQERESFVAARRRWLEERTLALAGVDRAELVAPVSVAARALVDAGVQGNDSL